MDAVDWLKSDNEVGKNS